MKKLAYPLLFLRESYSIGTVYGYVNDFPIKNYIEATLLLIQGTRHFP